MQPSATPVISCLKGVSATSPAAKIPGIFVRAVLSVIISSLSFVLTPKVFAKSERTICPIAINNPANFSSLEPL